MTEFRPHTDRPLRKYILFLFLLLVPLSVSAQHSIAEETLHVEASSATLRSWLARVEREGKMVLAYNSGLLDMDRRMSCTVTGMVTVGRLLSMVLADYDYKLLPMPGRKLLIQVLGPRLYDLTGTVREQGTQEHLMGATVTVTDAGGRRTYAVTDHDGTFNVGVARGTVRVAVSYVGYAPEERVLTVDGNRMLSLTLKPVPFEVKAVHVKRRKSMEEMDEVAPSNMVSFSNADLFSQIRILPGVSASSANMDFSVAGGSTDENLFLLDGFPVYNPGHINSMLTLFNGDAVKSVSFYNGFIPTQYEGRLSSVTDVHLRDGNKQTFSNTLSLDMPSASAVLEGPILKNRLSYLVAGRHSWLDFFDEAVSSEDRMNHSFHDENVKLSCDLDSVTTLSLSAYNSVDDYRAPGERQRNSMLHWNNQLYALRFNTLLMRKVSTTASVAYSRHTTRANTNDYFDEDENPTSGGNIRNRIQSIYVNTEFTYMPGTFYTMRWGLKGDLQRYELTSFGRVDTSRWQPTMQLALFYDNRVRVAPWLYAQVGLNYVRYMPRHNRSYNSVQPRFSLKASLGDADLVYGCVSRMEQFFHHIRVSEIVTPFDFVMPSIGTFGPTTGTHVELGWKHYTARGILELSAYYKRRAHVLALRPNAYIEDSNWANYVMAGTGESYGMSFYYYDHWRRLGWQLSYMLSQSREWFDELRERGRMPAAYDVPHVLNGAVSYNVGRGSLVTVGGNLHSGRILGESWDEDGFQLSGFRSLRDPLRYRLDASYSWRKEFRRSKLLLRAGLYNIVGNPSEEDMFFYFSVKIRNHCVPFGTVTFRF